MKKTLWIILTVVFLGSLSFASDNHNHEAAVEPAPHGGMLRDITNEKNEVILKSEAVLTGETVKIYVYGKDLKPIKLEKDTLLGQVQFPRQKSKPITFKKNGEFYETKILGINKVHRYDMHVTLEIGGKKAKADFGIDNIN